MEDSHYLKAELYNQVSNNLDIFEFLYQSSLDGIWYWDTVDGNNEWMSPEFWKLLGYDPNERKHLVSEWQKVIHPDDLTIATENYQKHCQNPEHPYDQVVRYRHKNGSTVWVRCRGVGIRDESGQVIRMLGAHTDVTHIKQVEQQLKEANMRLEKLSIEDPMTSLLNRNGLVKKFEEYVATCMDNHSSLGIALIDVDNFKAVNDQFGHLIGDEFLIILSNCIKSAQTFESAAVRLGGDEFAVLIPNATLEQTLAGAEKIRNAIEGQFGESCALTVSIGVSSVSYQQISQFQTDKDDSLALLHRVLKVADEAMYQAKESGKNTVSIANGIETVIDQVALVNPFCRQCG
ncbi:sensor domain-containing diguanylate cyclase [Vibrio sp. S4M6]|uniref:sensor domain-containing diguanylate cyclase n=1 Tax=Vibrio sinus TaxID=2946865 RepID=UPI002029C309|nr:sensor domain-containing diguanylate cyclase [Vibrio sinus]MCL9781661.1 sensor domain-containing diguanylate cyclase [Vibrio sinus]